MKTRLLLAAQKLSNWLIPLAAVAMIFGWLWIAHSAPGILGDADSLGYAVCHRLYERSFHFADGIQLPLCARCSGMYLGAVVGLVFQAFFSRRKGGMPPRRVIILLALLGLAFAFDGGNSYLYLMKTITPGRLDFLPTFYIPNNTLRLLTGSGAGLGIAVALFPSFNQTMWKNWDPSPALGSLKPLAVLMAIMLGLDLLVLTDSDLVLYPVAIISAGGVLLLLTLVYEVLWVMVMRRENTFTAFRHTWLPALAGLTIALLQITATDLFRLWLTHTWGGFPLPLGVG
ncbi:MAG: DUF2085 domain-containing protein [Anaerolineales bacterium]